MAKDSPVGTIITLGVIGAAAWALYEWLSSQCSTPGSSLYGGTICGLIPGVAPAVVAPVSTPSNTPASNPAGPAVAAQTTAVLTNATAPGQPFQAGDSFSLIVSGPPNQPVTGAASQNGSVVSSTNFGTTNANGQLTILGSWDSTDVGTWQETWQAGSALPAALNFSIAAAPGGTSGLGYAINRLPMRAIHRGRV